LICLHGRFFYWFEVQRFNETFLKSIVHFNYFITIL